MNGWPGTNRRIGTMSELLTVEIPNDLAQRARALAAATNRRLEDAVVDWIGEAVAEPDVGSLSDESLQALCEATIEAGQQEELSDLLARHREGELTEADRARLDGLMAVYRSGLVRKARALKEAAARGLRPRLDDDAA
jgi:hypothetical protein